MTKQNYERLGVFYLGKEYDIDAGELLEQKLLYDSKDLMTHAVCVGMTGSGKTGLCLGLLEEAAMDGIPAIVIDPKGDIGNLMLTFPNLSAAEFRPWIDEGVALRQGQTPDQFAAAQANLWKKGLADWDQDGDRIASLRDKVDIAIYTPGGDAGLPVTVLKSFDAPPPQFLENQDAFRERVASAASGLLALLGVDADPVRSREHILLSNILDRAWRDGRNLNLPLLIREIQNPPFETVGVMDLESFFPAGDRLQLAMTMNNLLASPSFASWMEGEPLNAQRLLYTPQGKPRVSILSIAHLSDAERMFFVTILLNEVLTWMRSQPGTSALRALLYMDEVFGYFPPTANPPSKQPMLTLLKQARAFGLGVVLATQNPVDLDYKGLSNTGTWFLGRLQTERDKARVLDGLEGASAQAGGEFDRSRVEKILSSLGKRVFMMSNAHDDHPAIFQTRWAMSYLRGPLTRKQIAQLMASRKAEAAAAPTASSPAAASFQQAPAPQPPSAAKSAAAPSSAAPSQPASRPTLPKSIDERFLAALRNPPASGKMVYRPALLGECRLHYSRTTYKVDEWREAEFLTAIVDDDLDIVWDEAEAVEDALHFDRRPEDNAEFGELPTIFTKARTYSTLETRMKSFLYRTQTATIWKCAELKKYSAPDEGEDVFRNRLTQTLREKRELVLEKLKKKYTSKMATLHDRIKRAEERVGRENSQFRQKSLESALSFGASILGAMFGRKLASRTNVSRATSSMRSIGRAASERSDIQRAQDQLEEAKSKLAALEAEFDDEIETVEEQMTVENLEFEQLTLAPKKTDITITQVALVWTPWIVDSNGIAEPAY